MNMAWLWFPLLGALAGVMAGLLGVGGGLVLVAALIWLLPDLGVPPQQAVHVALATSLASIIVTGASSARSHHRRGSVLWPLVLWLVPGLLLGGWLGSGLASRLDGAWLRWGVAAYCLLLAAQMASGWPRPRGTLQTPPPASAARSALRWLPPGIGIGVVSALVGIGGGSLTVPLLIWRGYLPVRAVGTSSACGVAIALASAGGYASQGPAQALGTGFVGFVFLPAALGIGLASVLAAPLGVRLAHRLSGRQLSLVFALFLFVMSLALAFTAP